MNALKTTIFIMVLACAGGAPFAQSGHEEASKRAILFADSLNSAFVRSDWNAYLGLSYPGVVNYYGGKKDFTEYISRARSFSGDVLQKISLLQIVSDKSEWQCVIKKTGESVIDGRRAEVVSYLVGQSTDDGLSWTYFDVAYNSVSNLEYIMPDMFTTLSVPQRQVIFDKGNLVSQN